MRILIDARSVATPAGRYVFSGLAREWARDPRVSELLAVVPEQVTFDLPEGIVAIRASRAGWLRHLLIELPAIVRRTAPDLVFAPNATSIGDPRVALYFQDLFQFTMPPGGGPVRDRVRERLRAQWRRATAPRVGALVAVSGHIATLVARELGRAPAVIPNGVDVPADRWSGDGNHVLVLGGIGGRKDEETALRAWARIAERHRAATRLLVIGVEPAERRRRLAALAEELGVARRVEIVGTVARERLLSEILRSRLAVSCSTFEAFGLPVAEALAIGAPLLCTSLPAHRELLARAGAGTAFPIRDDAALAGLLSEALDGRLPQRTVEVPHDWSWSARASQHLDLHLGAGTTSDRSGLAPAASRMDDPDAAERWR